jgi:ADP-heptose:LPS heptosyltransferase
MHQLKFLEELRAVNITLEKDVPYVVETQMVGPFAMAVSGNIETEPMKMGRRYYDNPNSILIMRAGGVGDILFLTPALKALREKYPSAHLALAANQDNHWILEGSGLVDSQVAFPIRVRDLARWDWLVPLEHTIEQNNGAHIVDIFATELGVKADSHKTTYKPSTDLAEFDRELPKQRKRIAVQFKASTPVRTYPLVWALKDALLAAGWEVVICCAPGGLKIITPIPHLHSTGMMNWSFRKSMDFLQTCDFVIGPDSSMIHFAAALGIPGIGLYGSFDAKLRLEEAGSIKAIQSRRECDLAPCFYHSGIGLLPSDGPCDKARMCTALAAISIDEIMAKMSLMGF